MRVGIAAIAVATLAGATMARAQAPTEDAPYKDVLRAGVLRVAVFFPQYSQDPKTGELRGDGHIVGTARALADRIGVALRLVEQPTPGRAIECLAAGACDLAYMGNEPSRAGRVNFSPPIFELDYTLLVPAGSRVQSVADADRPGVRIAAVRNHASTLTLERIIKRAEFVYADTPDPTFALLRAGSADAFASVAYALHPYAKQIPGSRVLEERYGFNSLSLAVPRGRAGWLAYVSEFVEEAKASGVAQQALAASSYRGIHVAPPAKR